MFFGMSRPDGEAVDRPKRPGEARASLDCLLVPEAHFEATHIVRGPAGQTLAEVAFTPDTSKLAFTDSRQGVVPLAVLLGCATLPYPHA
jgi:gluconolactonase